MKLRKVLSLLVALAMMVQVLPLSLFANDMESVAEYTVSESVTVDASSLADNDELLEGYIEQLFGTDSNSGIMLAATYTGEDALDDVNLEVYTALKSAIANIASGAESSTVITVNVTRTTTDLGVAEITDDDTLSAAMTAFDEVFDSDLVLNYLMNDCPYELYWYDKLENTYLEMGISGGGTTFVAEMHFTMPVATAYQADGSTTTVDSSKVTAATTAASYAQSLVSTYSSYSDEEKLEAFKETICSLVSYETDYASADFGDIWQLVYVFDQDSTTNVVCEGYSKAFQYLCDLAGLESIIVTGTMSGGTGAGEHMWNVVYLDGVNYLVDVTNSDDGSVGQDGGLFMVCADDADASDETGYTFTVNNQTVSYVYDSTTLELYPEDYLTLGTVTVDEYTITVYADGCTYDVVSSALEGEEVTLTITPKSTAQVVNLTYTEREYDETYDYYYTVQWEEVTYTGESSYTYTFTMPGNEVQIVLLAGEYEVTYSTEGYGFAFTNLDLANAGDTVTINAWVYDGCSLVDISIIDSDNNVITSTYSGNSTIYFYNSDGEVYKTATNEIYEFTMPASDVTVTVTFSEAPYSITVDDNVENGTITTYSTSAIEGDSIPFLVEPDEGYAISEVTVTTTSGETVELAVADEENGLYIFYMPASDVVISAAFEEESETYNVSIADTDNGTVISSASTADEGETVTLTITPDTGYDVSAVAVIDSDGNEVTVTEQSDGTYTFEMPASDVTVTVTVDIGSHTHTLTHVEATDATCTEDGNTEYWYCDDCDKYFSDEDAENEITLDDTVVEATGHDYGCDAATFTLSVSAYSLMSYAQSGDTLDITLPYSLSASDDVVLPVSYTLTVNGVTVSLKGSDGTGSGTYTQTVDVGYFAMNYSESANAMIPQSTSLSGDIVVTAIVDCSAYGSDCTIDVSDIDSWDFKLGYVEAGSEDGVGVNADGMTISKTYESANVSWAWSDDYSSATATFTCKNDSSHTETADATVTSETVKEATCTATGSAVYTAVVDMDGTSYTETKTVELPMIDHTEGEAVTENEVAATCTEDDSYESVVYCSVCGEELSRETVTVDATGHNYVATETSATCTEGGYTTYVCSECGDTYTDSETEALGHDYESEVTKEPTCAETGVMTYTCSRCGDSYTEEIDMVDHTYGEPEWTWVWSETEQTYNVTAKFTCTVCGGTDTETALVTFETTDATCTATGSTVYTAVVDMDGTSYSDTKTVELPMIAHTEGKAVTENEVAATCTTDGSYDTVVYCSVCGEELSRETVTVPATGHTEGEAVTENEVAATCTTDGSYDTVVYCSVCGEELSRETITVPATGHTTEIQNAVDATCTEDGYTGDEVCTVCGETITVGTVIPATGHSFNSEGVCEACGAKTGETGTASTVTVETDDTIFANVLPSGLVTSATISISNDNGGTLVVSTVVEISAYPYLVEHIADTLSFTLYNEAQGDDLISDTNSFTITTTENNKKTLKKVSMLFYGDVDYSGTGTSTVTMNFAATSDLSSSDIYVLHYTGSYPTWEVVTSTVTFGDTAVTVEFEASDYSPFVVLSVASASSGGSSSIIDILLRISANYSDVTEAIDRANALNPSDYENFSAVTEAINAVNWNLKAINQLTVNAYADAINTAIDNLVKTTANITEETVNIAEPIEDTNSDTEDDEESSETPEPESNPTTGIAFSILPMVIAALAAASSKRR
ncbi:MAG: hypothetical protein LIO49_03370 [Ruminococcus sp.]|nr:hypothetical protein [Ruminococcus sp.]